MPLHSEQYLVLYWSISTICVLKDGFITFVLIQCLCSTLLSTQLAISKYSLNEWTRKEFLRLWPETMELHDLFIYLIKSQKEIWKSFFVLLFQDKTGSLECMFPQFPLSLTNFSLPVGGYFLALSRELHTLLGTTKFKVAGVSWAWFILLFMFWFSTELYRLSSEVYRHCRQKETFICWLYIVQRRNGLLVKELKYYNDGCVINT